MKTKILSIDGKEKTNIELPKVFDSEVREDIVAKVLEAKKVMQPYAPFLMAGKQHAAKGKIVHRRHVWKSQYGRGWSRVPRKLFTRKGSQFHMEAAEVPHARGGMRAHPPKIISMTPKRINKKELKIALNSAIAATSKEEYVKKKYSTIKGMKELPLVIDKKILSLKTKDLLKNMKNILGELYGIAIKKKTIRAGRGKLRGRKYKSNAGMLLVIGNDEKLKTNAFDVKQVKNLSISDLAKGGLGRLTVYTEKAIKGLGERFEK